MVFKGQQRIWTRVADPTPYLEVRWRIPCRALDCVIKLRSLAAYLGMGNDSPLARRLEGVDGIALDNDAWVEGWENHNDLLVRIDGVHGVKPEALEAALWSVLREVKAGGVEPTRWRNVRTSLATLALQAQQSAWQRAYGIGLVNEDRRLDNVADELAILQSLSTDQLSALAREWLDETRYLAVLGEPSSERKRGVHRSRGDLQASSVQGSEAR